MGFAIGLRFYKLFIHRNGDRNLVKFNEVGSKYDFLTFISDFVEDKKVLTDEGEDQRSWYIENRPTNSIRSKHGLIKYGTHGFESRLVDNNTRKENYHRKATDLEEIPLYFQFWVPSNSNCGFATFQSFQGRSCVGFVMRSMQIAFEAAHPGFRLSYLKIMPTDGERFLTAPVKTLTMVRTSIPNDKFDGYLNGVPRSEVEYSVQLKAKRNSSLGILKHYKKPSSKEKEIIMYDGVEFEDVKAEISFGNKRRTVGLYGSNSEAGVIEISDQVEVGLDGHPLFNSIAGEADQIFSEISKMVKT